MRKRLAAIGLTATLALTGGGAVACDGNNGAEDLREEGEDLLDDAEKELDKIQDDNENS